MIAKPFLPGEQSFPDGRSRAQRVVRRVMAMSETEVAAALAAAVVDFGDRHHDLRGVLELHFGLMANRVETPENLSSERRLLIGAYFTQEYSIEAVSLGNPSMVPAPDQSGLQPGEQRFIMSLRAIGEGHISSIEFRSGVIDRSATIAFDEQGRFPVTGVRRAPAYENQAFTSRLSDVGGLNDIARLLLDHLPERFTMDQLEEAIGDLDSPGIDRLSFVETTRRVHWLASSNYTLTFPEESQLSDRVIVPAGPTESHGMEDARFVRFVHDDGSATYYATYTAYDGVQILPQLIETPDFVTFRIATLSGTGAQNKGIALFPRMIGGRYAALSRQDNESNYLMLSDEVRHWPEKHRIQVPSRPWELTQLGNCGSPVETEAGWLVITHGVGPLRRYSLGAILLDIDDPYRVIGHLKDPLLVPENDERDGYVPNVVYSCGSMIHDDHLVLPYGFADVGNRVALIPIEDLLNRLTER